MAEINYRKLNYYGTKVSISKTQEDIKKILKKFGLEGIRFTEYKNTGIIEFILLVDVKELAFRFAYDLPEQDNHKRQVYRALFYYLKNRFLAVEFGITTVEKEFLQELVLRLPDGSDSTVKEIIQEKLPQLNYKNILLPFKNRGDGP